MKTYAMPSAGRSACLELKARPLEGTLFSARVGGKEARTRSMLCASDPQRNALENRNPKNTLGRAIREPTAAY